MKLPKISGLQAALIIILAISLNLTLASLGWLLTGAHNDTLAPWVAATATALGLTSATAAAIFAAGAFQREQARDEERDKAQLRAQADLVAIWAEADTVVHARNASTVPVYEITIGVQIDPLPAEPYWDDFDDQLMPPSSEPRQIGLVGTIRDVWRQNDWNDYGWAIKFTDAAGQRWYRNSKGRLIHLGLSYTNR